MKNWSLNLKLTFLMALFAIGTITVAVVGVLQLDSINTSLNYLTSTVSERVRYAVRMDANTNSIMNLEKTLILENDPVTQKKISENLNKKTTELKANLDVLKKIGLSDNQKLTMLENAFGPMVEVDKQIQNLAFKGENEAAFELARTKGQEVFGQFDSVLSEVNLSAQKEMELESKKTDEVYKQALMAMVVISSAVILFCALLGFGILRAINKAINQVIEDLTNNSEQVSVAARQISVSSQDLSQAATEQASSLEETSSSVEEISSMVKRNSENANSSAEASVEGQKSCEKGKQVIGQMILSMKEINEANDSVVKQVNESNEKIGEIVKVINEMGEKTKVINDIVFQTKLLSFNASVEAARAGEHGKGFAVVAEEVGNLAQMSGKAATEISEMLESSIQKVEASISESKEKINNIILVGKSKVDEGERIARECGEVLDEIVLKSSEINEMVKSIASASEEQSDGIEQITTAMTQLDQVTQTNASTSEEAASAAEELSGQADQLKEAVAILVLNIKGGKGTKAATFSHATKEVHHDSSDDSKVVQFKPKSSESSQQLAKASGFGGVPDADDVRFKEV